jgi:hypothetical protein
VRGVLLVQELLEVVQGKKLVSEVAYLAALNMDEFTLKKGTLSIILRWLQWQKFVGDPEVIELDVSFSSQRIRDLITASPELQQYFQIKAGALAFAEGLSEADAWEMIQYAKTHYRPQVNIDFL